MNMGNPHVLAIPYPAQGHVIPLMELGHQLARHGCQVTFVNTDFVQKRVTNALSERNDIGDQIQLVSIPDGLEPWEDRDDITKTFESVTQVMPGKLEELIQKINESDGDKITCIIADATVTWALEVAEKMGIGRVAFWPASAATLALTISIPKLIDDGILDNSGAPMKNMEVKLSPTMPAISTANFFWNSIGDSQGRNPIFQNMTKFSKVIKIADWLICNSTYDLEPAAFTLFPESLPIGPLLAGNQPRKSAGYFWPEDSACLKWLDQQPASSVIYVAFGSHTVFNTTQFQELALGLELTKRPFLWVVRPDLIRETNDPYPEGFRDRIAGRGRIVGWAPQQKVLCHPSVACFLSHCGWNSIMEGVSNGIPFLCWAYFADQFTNQTYICDVWMVGLGFNKDQSGIITREEIKGKVDQLLRDKTIKAKALDLKSKVMDSVKDGGLSHKNFNDLIVWMKGPTSSFHEQA